MGYRGMKWEEYTYSVVETTGKAKFETVVVCVFNILWGHISELRSKKMFCFPVCNPFWWLSIDIYAGTQPDLKLSIHPVWAFISHNKISPTDKD